jgi:hypothetical protein
VIGGSFVGFRLDGQFLHLESQTTSRAIPEPATLALLGLSALALAQRRRAGTAKG